MSEQAQVQARAGLEAARKRAPVTDRVNVEPAILNGMTFTEAKMIALASLLVFMLIGALIFTVTRFWQVLLVLAIFGPGLTLWFGSKYLQTVKRNRPDGYYTQAIHLWLVERALSKARFIQHRGHWDLGRTLDFSLASALPVPEEVFAEQPARPTHFSETRT